MQCHYYHILYYEENCNQGAIADTRSVLSAILPSLLKVIFRLRPKLPKYTVSYNPGIILAYVEQLPNNSELLPELLTVVLKVALKTGDC